MQSNQYINNRSISPVLESDLFIDADQQHTNALAESDSIAANNASDLSNNSNPISPSKLETKNADEDKENQIKTETKSTAANASEPIVRGRPSACVFVASLCSTRSDDELCISVTDHFQQWGKLTTVKVLRDTANRPYAFVQYTNDKDSKLAIKEGHNSILDGRNIRCEAAKVNRTLFITVRNLINEYELRNILEEFGEIEQLVSSNEQGNIFLSKNSYKGSKNWFCKYAYRDDAIRAFANLTDENSFKVEWAQNIEEIDYKSGDRIEQDDAAKIKFDKYSIFVGQLSQKISEDDLRERFERHGEVVDITIVRRPANTFAFIKFKDESSAASAVERENHSMFNGKTMHVQYREIHSSTNKTNLIKPNGIALAPPPINLTRRSISGSDIKNNDSNFLSSRKLSSTNHNTYPISKPKFNGHASNNYNRGSNYKNSNYSHSYNNYNNQKNYNYNSNKSFGITGPSGKNKVYKFNEFNYSKPKAEPHKDDSPTPPPSVQTSDSHTLVKSGYSPSSAVNSERSDYSKNSKKNNKAEGVNANVPYFYYIPSTEVTGNVGSPVSNKFSPPPSYYNPYQQYYLPYEPGQPQGTYAIPPFPMYYPATGNESEFDNFPPIEKEK